MSKTRDTGFINNIVKYDTNGNVSIVSGSTTLLSISSSGAITTTGVISGSAAANATSASYAVSTTSASYALSSTSASYAINATTASYALSATSTSFTIQSQTASSADAFTVRNTLTAQTLVVQTITSSVDFVTGSTRFGSLLDNTHQLTGSVSITGSLSGTSAIFTQSGTTTVSVNATSNTAYSAFIHAENGVNKTYLEYINSAYADSSRRNYFEAFNTVGGVSIWTNSIKALDINTSQTATFTNSVGIGATPDNTYQGLTIYGANPSLRLKTNQGGGWTWTEYVNSSGTNNFSIGVNQSVPFFGIKAGAGLDNPNFVMLSNGNVGIGTITPNNPLHVETTALNAGVQIYTNEASDGGSAPLFLSKKSTAGSIKTVNIESSGIGTFYIRTGATALNSYGSIRLGIEADGAMSYNSSTIALRTFTLKALPGREIAMEFLESGSIHAVYIRPRSSGRHLISSDYISGGTFLPLSLSGRENDADLVLQTNGNVSIGNSSDIGTKFQVNGANYVEMATFACTSAAAAEIVSSNQGYVQFSSGNIRHCSNTDLFVPATNGIRFTKAGIVHVTFSQDITTTGTTGYVAGYIRKNGDNISENLITNTNSQWDGINGVGTINVAVTDVIGFFFNAAEITSFDPGSWSQYSFIWTSR